MPRSSRSSSRQRNESPDDDMITEVVKHEDVKHGDEDDDEENCLMFSSQMPQDSQALQAVRESERNKLEGLSNADRDKMLRDMTRHCLFTGLAGDAIDRTALTAAGSRTTGAALEIVNQRLKDLFDFELQRTPAWMTKSHVSASKAQKTLYLVNVSQDDGKHSKAIHEVHGCAERGLLMTILALIYCKGWWINDEDLYNLLNRVDHDISAEPPNTTTANNMASQRHERSDQGFVDVPTAIKRFVAQDYLVMRKTFDDATSLTLTEYGMGPRAALEIGRIQIIYFCAEIMGQDPDPAMLEEVADGAPVDVVD